MNTEGGRPYEKGVGVPRKGMKKTETCQQDVCLEGRMKQTFRVEGSEWEVE